MTGDIEEIEAEVAPVVHTAIPHAEDIWGVGDADAVDIRVVWERLDL